SSTVRPVPSTPLFRSVLRARRELTVRADVALAGIGEAVAAQVRAAAAGALAVALALGRIARAAVRVALGGRRTAALADAVGVVRSEEHTSELQSRENL